ncbi:MAG TPA: hypothetical protein VKZ53_18425 [Candidatus Angelobacter sp.]|nr:hypothetical protein [Candidatus Angelobacter sp.]
MRNLNILLFTILSALAAIGQTCGDSNTSQTFSPMDSDKAQHSMGSHFVSMGSAVASCTYTSSSSSTQQNCNTQCNVVNAGGTLQNPLGGTIGSDNGTLSVLGSHEVDKGWRTGQAGGVNAGASCTGVFGGGAVRCSPFTMGCNVSVTVSLTGVTVTSSNGDVIWTSTNQVPITCATIPDPENQVAGGGGGAPEPQCDLGFAGDTQGPCSPIIIDTVGEGFHLTSAQNGVTFDIRGDGHPLQISWTAAGFHNAFLALPGLDGMVHNGKELFGNFTPQPQSANPNGFLALAEFDKAENGGNGDGVIDEQDAVYSKLRLWIDENHDGISQPNELHTLPELGVYSLSLRYFESRRQDEFGNQFRFKSRVNPGKRRDPKDEPPTGEPGRWAYDVFFVTQQSPSSQH